MILHEITGDEHHPAYKTLETSNGSRQYSFLESIVTAALEIQRPFISTQIIKSLNFHAIACLHINAGQFRPCPVVVGDKDFPPNHVLVTALMDDLINQVNRNWESSDPVALASFLLWKINQIHPFINGNGRTARAAAYFVICVKLGFLLPGTKILPELLRENRDTYIAALVEVDKSSDAGDIDLTPLNNLLNELLKEQLKLAVDELGDVAENIEQTAHSVSEDED